MRAILAQLRRLLREWRQPYDETRDIVSQVRAKWSR